MRINKFLSLIWLFFAATLLASCGEDEPYVPDRNNDYVSSTTEKIVKPTFKKDLSAGINDGVKFYCRFDNGNDDSDNMSCIVHWIAYYNKPSSTPTKSDMYYHDNMRLYQQSSSSTVFEKEHAGRKTWGYVYYYFECSNSKGSTETDISHVYVRKP